VIGEWRKDAACQPYYADDAVTLYHGDCREIVPALGVKPGLVLTDPPYGVDVSVDHDARAGRKQAPRYRKVVGDREPFDPSPWLAYPKVILWGGNCFADRLPPSRNWIVWDKREHTPTNARSDADLAWCSFPIGGIRMFRHYWNGPVRASERGYHVHPTQKPVALMHWIINQWTEPGDLVLDPYAGSGPVLRAAKDLGRRAIGVELDERYCEVIARRLAQDVLPLGEVIL
jgi:site-specific DNA-methyltransferase (adenine-specific)